MTALMMLINRSVEMFKQEDGQGLVEYSLIFILVVLILMAAMTTLGFTVKTVLYDQLATQLFS